MRFVGAISSSMSREMDARGRTGSRGGGDEHPSDRARAVDVRRGDRAVEGRSRAICHADLAARTAGSAQRLGKRPEG